MGKIWSGMKTILPPSYFTTGIDLKEKSVKWTIENFNVLRQDRRMINSQKIDFSLGTSKWVGQLMEEPNNGRRWISLYIRHQNREPFGGSLKAKFVISSGGGWPIKIGFERQRQEVTIRGGITCVRFAEFIDADIADSYFWGFYKTIVIRMRFTVMTPSQPNVKSASSLEDIMAKFQPKFFDQLRKDLSGLLETRGDPCSDIKIVSNDKKEFTLPKGTLAVRSEVFAAMLRSDMIEANSGVVNLPDISSKALKVLLNFLKTGELLPEWRETEIIVELTNAAGKYQLQDLLQFLDEAMGRVCQLENVGALATLARRLSLRRAEDELMQFARREGVGSVDNFIRMWKSELAVIDDESLQA